MSNVVKQTAAYPVALRPPLSQEIFEVECRTSLQRLAPTMRQDVRLDPFGDSSVVDADLRRDIDKGLA
jgi:hypothetical protein